MRLVVADHLELFELGRPNAFYWLIGTFKVALRSGPSLLAIPLLPINSQILRFGSLSHLKTSALVSLNPTLLLFLSLTQTWLHLDSRYVSLDAELQKLLLLFRLCQGPTCWILCYTLIFWWAENWVRYLGIAALKGLEFRQCSWQAPQV